MNEEFRIVENTLVEYKGHKRSYEIFKGDGDLMTQITTWYRDNIAQVTVPGGEIKKIAYKAFHDCPHLRKVHIGMGVREIDFGAFWGTNLEEIWLPKDIRFSADCFPVSDRKVTIHIDYSRGAWSVLKRAGFVLKNIRRDIFEKNVGLFLALKMAYRGQVKLNLDIINEEDVGDKEFAGMAIADVAVTFHSNIHASYIFERSMVTKVCIDKDVEYITPEAFSSSGDPFFEGTSIEEIVVVNGNPHFHDIDGVLFKSHQLIKFPDGRLLENNEYRIPATCSSVRAGAFNGCIGIERLYVPKTTILEQDALAGMFKLDLVYREA